MIKALLVAGAAYFLFWRKPAAAAGNGYGAAEQQNQPQQPQQPSSSEPSNFSAIFAHKGAGVFAAKGYGTPNAYLRGGDALVGVVTLPTIVEASLRAMQISYGILNPQVAIRHIAKTSDEPAYARVVIMDPISHSQQHKAAKMADGTGHLFQIVSLHR